MASLSPVRARARAATRTTVNVSALPSANGRAKPALELASLVRAWPAAVPEALRRLANKLVGLTRGPLTRPGDRRWLARIVEEAAEPDASGLEAVYEALVWAHALPWLEGELPAGAVQELFDRLRRRTQRWPREGAAQLDAAALLACTELPLALAGSRPREEVGTLGARGAAALENWCAELQKRPELPGRLAPLTPTLAASWVRSRELVARCGMQGAVPALDRGAVLVREALRTLRRDGSSLFGQSGASAADRRWLVESARSIDATLPRLLKASESAKPPRAKGAALPPASFSSEEAGVSILRTAWHAGSHALAIRVEGERLEGELLAGGSPLVSGAWRTAIVVDGAPLTPRGAWEPICYETDEGGEYLELGLDFDRGWSLERHLFLARTDGVCFVADALLGPSEADVSYELALPVAEGVSVAPERDTNEAWLGAARVLPLALPEWRSMPARGQLLGGPREFLHRATGRGARLFFPLWIDLDRTRRNQEATWRPLTVAQDREICPSDVVVAYRAQIGRRQWLVYRSLAERGNRTVIGQNLVYELTLGRLTPKGELEKLIEIE